MKKRFGAAVLAVLLSLSMLGSTSVDAAVYYEKKIGALIGKGVTYETNSIVTEKGLVDIYVLKIPLDDQHIKVSPVHSLQGNGLKERTTKLLQDNNAIAGVNGDFFNMKGSHSAVIGPMIIDGSVVEAGFVYEEDSSKYAALFIDENNNPFIDYITTSIKFLNNGAENMPVRVLNKITDMSSPVCVTRDFMTDTSVVDSKFEGLVKVVVEEGTVTQVSQKGETVLVPENGFVVLSKADFFEYYKHLIHVGNTAEIKIEASVNFDNINTAIGGGGKILVDGKKVEGGHVPSGRHPRTAVGFSQDKTQLIMMVVDGRGGSIGATADEMGDYMLRYGAYDAMHLDGGGSSTMGVKQLGEDTVKLVNDPSDGGQRLVANALGVLTDAPVGEPVSLKISPQSSRVFKNTGVPINIYGLDEYYNTIPMDSDQVITGFTDLEARYENGYFYPSTAGKINFTATNGDLAGSIIIESMEIVQLIPNKSKIDAGVGGGTVLDFTGKSDKSWSAYIYDGVKYEIVPEALGHMEGNKFVADQEGAGYIKCQVGDAVCYIDVNVGFTVVTMTKFEEDQEIKFEGYPENVTGSVRYATGNGESGKAAELTYAFGESEETQCAYLTFTTPLTLRKNSYGLKLDVYGDNSYNWLRARLVDGNGKEHLVDLASQLNWEGWKSLTVSLPSGMKEPVKLDRLYVAATATNDTEIRQVLFDNMSSEAVTDHGKVDHPANTKFSDPLNVELAAKAEKGFDLTIAGDLSIDAEEKPDNYDAAQKKALELLKTNTSRILFAGEAAEIKDDLGVKIYKWNKNYNANTHENVMIIQMTAAQGNIFSTNPKQWESFYNDLIASTSDHIIIQMDISPLNFTVGREQELFHELLEEIASTSNKNIVVVSTEGTSYSSNAKNGIRYINLGGLWTSKKEVNPEFGILRLRINGAELKYDFQKMK